MSKFFIIINHLCNFKREKNHIVKDSCSKSHFGKNSQIFCCAIKFFFKLQIYIHLEKHLIFKDIKLVFSGHFDDSYFLHV